MDWLAWMFERCTACQCLLNNSPECDGGECAHPTGCPPGPDYGPPSR